LAASVIVGSYEQNQAKKKAREQYNAAQVDRMAERGDRRRPARAGGRSRAQGRHRRVPRLGRAP
jgi:hypothetical protein